MKEEDKKKFINLILIVVFVIASFLVGFYSNDSSQESYLFKTILKADYDFSKVSIDSQMAEQYYVEAGYFYEKGNYNLVESNCRLAREYYSNEVQGYEKIKAELKAVEIEDELIYLYINVLEEIIDATYNMFEACEYFESAVRYYDTYFNTNVPYDDMSYDMASGEMDSMGEKITAHDEAVGKYNNLLEEFRVELERRIE